MAHVFAYLVVFIYFSEQILYAAITQLPDLEHLEI